MHISGLAVRHSAAHRGLLCALFLLVTVIGAFSVGIVGFLDAHSHHGVRSILRSDRVDSSLTQIHTRLAGNPDKQNDVLTALLAGRLPAHSYRVQRSVRIDEEPLVKIRRKSVDPDRESTLTLGALPDVQAHAMLVSGVWASDSGRPAAGAPVPITVDAHAAKTLGVRTGDVMTAGITGQTTPMKVVGTYRKTAAGSAYWFTEPSSSSRSAGLAITGAAALRAFDSTPVVYWTIQPDLSSLRPDQVKPLAHALTTLVPNLSDNSAFNVRGVLSDGNLRSSLQTVSTELTASYAIGTVPLVLIGITSLVALVQVAKLLAAARDPEYTLLRARGLSARQVVGLTLFEAAGIALAGSAVGTLAGLAAEWAATGRLSDSPYVPVVAAGIFAASTVIVAGSGIRAGLRRRDVNAGGRAGRAVATGGVIIACIAAAVSLWRFRSVTGSSIVRADSATDPLVIAAPGLCLLALSLLALLAFGPLSRLVHRMAARRPGLLPALPLAQVSRRVLTFAVPVILTVFAVGGITMAASYSGSWQPAQKSSALLENGADVRINPSHDAAMESTKLQSAAPGNVPVLTGQTALNNGAVTLTSIPQQALTRIVPSPAGLSMDALRKKLTRPGPKPLQGIALPAGARTVTLDTTLAAALKLQGPNRKFLSRRNFQSFQAQTSITVANNNGSLEVLDLQPIELTKALLRAPRKYHATLTARLPATRGSWRIVALDGSIGTAFGTTSGPGRYTFSVTGLHSTDAKGRTSAVDVTHLSWKPQSDASTAGYHVQAHGLSYTCTVTNGTGPSSVRVMPAGPHGPLPIAVSQSVLPLIDQHVGDTVQLGESPTSIDAKIVAAVPLIPGTTTKPAVLTDLTAYDDAMLRGDAADPQPNEIWAASADPHGTASRVLAIDPAANVSTSDSGASKPLLSPATTSFWAGAAGSLLLTATAIIAFELSLLRSRRFELVTMRAVGVSGRQIVAARRLELLGVTFAATAAGMIAGGFVTLGVVAGLTRSAIPLLPAESTIPLHLNVWWWLASIALFLGLLGLVGLVSGVRTRRQYADTDYREVGPYGA